MTWEGWALGAPAKITLYGEPCRAEIGIRECLAETRRLEAEFSLFDPQSSLARLNQDGFLDAPTRDFLELARLSQHVSALTEGAFDVTLQPIWQCFASHFSRPGADPAGPAADEIAAARALTGWQDLIVDEAQIRFRRSGMAASFNGIAQGYVTDRASKVLAEHGFPHVLVDLGELRANGVKRDGTPWQIGSSLFPQGRFELSIGAVATSSRRGTVFDAEGRFGHIFADARDEPTVETATVTADDAAIADALSTAIVAGGFARTPRWLAAAGASIAAAELSDGTKVYRTKDHCCTKGQL